MPGSIIIFGGSRGSRIKTALSQISKILNKDAPKEKLLKSPDVLFLETPKDKKSIGIADVKESAGFVSEKPFSEKYKFLVIADAGAMTREAQNSLLKILEEPPSHAGIILLAKTLNDLLETVVSRCKRVKAGDGAAGKDEEKGEGGGNNILSSGGNSYSSVLDMDALKRLSWAGEIYKEEKEVVVEILEDWIAQARKIMIDSPSIKVLNNIGKINEVKNDIENTNVNLRLALEALVLNLE